MSQPIGEALIAEPATPIQPEHRNSGDQTHGIIVRLFASALAITGSAAEWLFGVVALILGLSILATVPVLQMVSLGYLLESGGRVARSGRLRDGIVGVRTAARLGTVFAAALILLLPIRLFGDLRGSAHLLGNRPAFVLLTIVTAVCCGLFVLHLAWVTARGGRLRSCLWPAPLRLWRAIRSGEFGEALIRQLVAWWRGVRFVELFWLGVRGSLVAMAWLIVPVTIVVAATRADEQLAPIIALLGAGLFAIVQLYLPFLQANFAKSRGLRDGFAVANVRRQFTHAPIAFLIGLVATLALALPLYVLKAELLPREAAWLPSIVFVLSIWPARLLVGWAIHRADRRDGPRHGLFRWGSWLAIVPVVLFYSLVVYLTQYLSWYGVWSLYEQHAYLLPVPFVGL